VIDKITKVHCLAKIWRKFKEITRDALILLLSLFLASAPGAPLSVSYGQNLVYDSRFRYHHLLQHASLSKIYAIYCYFLFMVKFCKETTKPQTKIIAAKKQETSTDQQHGKVNGRKSHPLRPKDKVFASFVFLAYLVF
jgi:Ca2+/Na+ antiporter